MRNRGSMFLFVSIMTAGWIYAEGERMLFPYLNHTVCVCVCVCVLTEQSDSDRKSCQKLCSCYTDKTMFFKNGFALFLYYI